MAGHRLGHRRLEQALLLVLELAVVLGPHQRPGAFGGAQCVLDRRFRSNNSDIGATCTDPAVAGQQAPDRPESLDPLSRRRLFRALGIAGGLVLGLLAASYGPYLGHFHGPASTDPAAWGQFGDFVGGTLNSLMGLLTLLALVFTVVLQTRQLELSRDELRATRHELARSTAAQPDPNCSR